VIHRDLYFEFISKNKANKSIIYIWQLHIFIVDVLPFNDKSHNILIQFGGTL